TSYVSFRQRHAEHQRQLETQIASLRAKVRQALSRSSAPLRQLAIMDDVMEQTLAAREQRLLSTVPQFLERRFVQLRKAHQAQLAASDQVDDFAATRGAGGWVDVFTREWQGVLLAELDVRLQPVVGMIEALSSESKKYP
ncbi:MAG TPA: DUF3348 family protein, partial [Ramlibacter sp.]|nr:DUF3348 family protein [Ramlibacter sp.]